ncbi:hypothetical protein HJFPF1_03253 [Paramyrothecium foliicola]|nr:hypothetical protein HJFPF1_03253 [Paramyrothecium foliicola]
MGQFLSYTVGVGDELQPPTLPAESPGPTPTPDTPAAAAAAAPLLQLPADVLLLLSDYLDPATALSLSLACRSTYPLSFNLRQQKLRADDKRELLLLLERDPIGRGTYYCHPCNKLHPFQQSWGPQSPDETSRERTFHCGNRDKFSPIGNPYNLSYPHARLAMNAHLYGAEHGIPLRNLEAEHTETHGAVDIRCSTLASIVSGELFIRRSYTFTIPTADIPSFRKCTGARDFRLCEHTSFFSNSSVYRQYVPELQRQPAADDDAFVPCTAAPGSCGLCLMDYDVTIHPASPASAAAPDGWSVSVDAYHQLGDCRSPEDWRWARFSEAARPHLFFPNRPNRRGSAHYPGVVKKRWQDGRCAAVPQSKDAVLGVQSELAQYTPPASWFWLWHELKRPLGFEPTKMEKIF